MVNLFWQIDSILNRQFLPLHILIMANSAYFVKSTPPRAFSESFLYFAGM